MARVGVVESGRLGVGVGEGLAGGAKGVPSGACQGPGWAQVVPVVIKLGGRYP